MHPTPAGPAGESAARNTGGVLVLILLVAAVVRLWGAGYGLPQLYHSDEGFEVRRALMLGAGQFDSTRAFKGGLYLLLFPEYAAYFLFLRGVGAIHSTHDFLVRYFADPTGFWLIGRLTVALIGVANVYLVYRLGRRLRDRPTGLLAALFLAFAYEHVWSSHFITVDVLMVTLETLVFLQVVAIARAGAMRGYLLAGLFASLAVMTKLPALVVLLAVAVAHGSRVLAEGRPLRDVLLDRRLLAGAGMFVVVMAVGNPAFVPSLIRLVRTNLGGTSTLESLRLAMDPYLARTDSTWGYYLGTMFRSLGPPVFICGMCGLVRALVRRRPEDLALALFAVASYLAICLPLYDNWVYPRYALPVELAVVLLGAQFASELGGPLAGRLPAGAGVALALAMVALPVARDLRQDMLFTRKDTRTLALEWAEANMPAGAKVVIEGRGIGASTGTIPLRNRPENVRAILDRYGEVRTTRRVGTPETRNAYRSANLEVLAATRTWDLMPTATEVAPYRPLQEYLDRGAQWVVIDPDQMRAFLDGVNFRRFPEVGNFYRDLQSSSQLELAQRFAPDGRLGPTLEIYRVR